MRDIEEATNELIQQIKWKENEELKGMIEQQKTMMEANQKLMNTLMQNIMSANLKQPAPPQNQYQGTGNKKPRWEEWQMEKKGETVQHNGKTWWWCPQHNDGKGLYVRHKPENHDKWLKSKTGGPAFREQE